MGLYTIEQRIYIMSMGSFFKIGRAQDPTKRAQQLSGWTDHLHTVCMETEPMYRAATLEHVIHETLSDFKVSGMNEYFDIDYTTAAYVVNELFETFRRIYK